jgi:hypothetical protein
MPVSDIITRIGIKTRIRIISILLLLVPVYFFIIGDYYGSGFQTPLFRYQEVFLGSFVVLTSNDVHNIITGFFQGSRVPAVILWSLGLFLLIVNIFFLFIDNKPIQRIVRRSGIVIIVAGIFFLLSIIVYYGPLFHNTLGIALPIGLPLIFLIGIWMYLWKEVEIKTDQAAPSAEPELP